MLKNIMIICAAPLLTMAVVNANILENNEAQKSSISINKPHKTTEEQAGSFD